MNRSRPVSLLALIAICLVCGCRQLQRSPENEHALQTTEAKPANVRQHIRNNCASLLYDLLNDEKNLSKLLIVKRESKELNELVKRISTAADNLGRQLEQLAQADRTLNLHVPGLPSGEAAVRETMAKTTAQDLLEAKGATFELKLLLTQTEGLNYGAQLAKVAAENESAPERVQVFHRVQNELEDLYRQVLASLRSTTPALSAQ